MVATMNKGLLHELTASQYQNQVQGDPLPTSIALPAYDVLVLFTKVARVRGLV